MRNVLSRTVCGSELLWTVALWFEISEKVGSASNDRTGELGGWTPR